MSIKILWTILLLCIVPGMSWGAAGQLTNTYKSISNDTTQLIRCRASGGSDTPGTGEVC